MKSRREALPHHERRKSFDGAMMINRTAPNMKDIKCLQLSDEYRKTKGWAMEIEKRMLSSLSTFSARKIRASADWAGLASLVVRMITMSSTVKIYLRPWQTILHASTAPDRRPDPNRLSHDIGAVHTDATSALSLTIGNVISNSGWVNVNIPRMKGICGKILCNHSAIQKRRSRNPTVVIEEDDICVHEATVDIPKHKIGNSFIITAPMYFRGLGPPVGSLQISRHGTEQTEDGPYTSQERAATFCFAETMGLRLTLLLLQGSICASYEEMHVYLQSGNPDLFVSNCEIRETMNYHSTQASAMQPMRTIDSRPSPPKISRNERPRLTEKMLFQSGLSRLSEHMPERGLMHECRPSSVLSNISRVSTTLDEKLLSMQQNAVRRAARRSLRMREESRFRPDNKFLEVVEEVVDMNDRNRSMSTLSNNTASSVHEPMKTVRWSRDPDLRAKTQLATGFYEGGPTKSISELTQR